MKTKSNSIQKIDKILCPNCLIPINTYLNNLKLSNGNNTQIKCDENSDFSIISCKNCLLNFTFISCPYCEKKIFMKIYQNNFKYNGLDGHNIRCPYKSCQQIFYFTECPKCKFVQKQKKFIKEGKDIICLNDNCKYIYIQVNCPIKYCTDLLSLDKQKAAKNFPLGIMLLHENEIMFQKINCYYCCRPIVYKSKKNHKNKYCEAQKVECPYNDCGKFFNRIICPNCNDEIYINDGWYEMGSSIMCYKCGKQFGKILCPACGKMNICEKNFFSMGHIKCGFHNCLKESNMINCLFCRKLNILDNNIQISGQVIKCGYCKNSFNQIFCPYCQRKNPFPLADFSFGKVYKCKYLTCNKEYQILFCPNCHKNYNIKNREEGHRLKCPRCQTLFMNWGCPFCKCNILDKNTKLRMGQLTKCPSKQCNKIYSFIRCSQCYRLIFSKENESLYGKTVKCPYQDCKAYSSMIYCQNCESKIIYNGKKTDLNEGENINCINCNKNFIYQKNNLLYNGDLRFLEQIEGKKIDFGIGEVDENYLGIQELFFFNKAKTLSKLNTKSNEVNDKDKFQDNVNKGLININEKNNIIPKNLGECIVCHNNLKESIFFPCGHRCACYKCAVIIFEIYKKCPKCNAQASCIIKKVYE